MRSAARPSLLLLAAIATVANGALSGTVASADTVVVNDIVSGSLQLNVINMLQNAVSGGYTSALFSATHLEFRSTVTIACPHESFSWPVPLVVKIADSFATATLMPISISGTLKGGSSILIKGGSFRCDGVVTSSFLDLRDGSSLKITFVTGVFKGASQSLFLSLNALQLSNDSLLEVSSNSLSISNYETSFKGTIAMKLISVGLANSIESNLAIFNNTFTVDSVTTLDANFQMYSVFATSLRNSSHLQYFQNTFTLRNSRLQASAIISFSSASLTPHLSLLTTQ